MDINYPTTKTEILSDGAQFVEVFKQLVQDKVASVKCNALGIEKITFKDGTSCGGMWLWKQTCLWDQN